MTDDRPSLEYGGIQYVRRPSRPPDLFDVSDEGSWCPACFAPGAPATFQGYRDVMARIYVSRDFLTRRPAERDRPTHLQLPPGPAVAAALEKSLFMRRMLGRWHDEYARAVDLLRDGRFGEAAASLEDVVRMAPEDAHSRARLGDAYLGLGRIADARAQFERALRISPSLPDAARGLERAGAAAG